MMIVYIAHFVLYAIVHPIQGARTTQGRELPNKVVSMAEEE